MKMWISFAVAIVAACPMRAPAAGSLGISEWFLVMVALVVGGLALTLYLTHLWARFVRSSWPWYIWLAAFALFVWKFFFTNW